MNKLRWTLQKYVVRLRGTSNYLRNGMDCIFTFQFVKIGMVTGYEYVYTDKAKLWPKFCNISNFWYSEKCAL
jgi:hypothetical protein